MENGTKRNLQGSDRVSADLMLLLAAIIWGGGFVAQRMASAHLGFFAFNGIRFMLAALVPMPFILKNKIPFSRRMLWVIPAGILFYAASALQQAGMKTTSAAAGGFLTSVYVVLVPLLLAIFWKQRSSPVIWAAALGALIGSYLLSTGGQRISPSDGDLLILAGSVLWALQVIFIGLAVRKIDAFVFSFGQFLVCGLLHLFSSIFVDPPTWQGIQACWQAVLYSGFASIGIGFTLQAYGQKQAPPADASLILSLEAVFGAIFGYLILHEELNALQVIGCVIIFACITFTQLFQLAENRKKALEVDENLPNDNPAAD